MGTLRVERTPQVAVRAHRSPARDIDPIFVERWSPRAMTGETVGEDKLMKLFEAARWAPSSYNAQPWRFLYARRGSEHWERFFALLDEFNKKWAADAGALVIVISKKTLENGKRARTHSFDAGAAWENFALQGSLMGLVIHGMEGFDYERARRELKIPDDYEIEAMIAVGLPAEPESLDEDLRRKETPSDRKPLREIVMEGRFRHRK